MSETTRVDFKVMPGPSTVALHPAVIADLRSPFDDRLQPAQVAAGLSQLLPGDRIPRLSLPVRTQALDDGRARILMGYHDAQATVAALQTRLELAAVLFSQSAGRNVDAAALSTLMQRARSMMQAARARNVPFYPVSEGSRIWQYGQGYRGIQFFKAANHFDSLTGIKLATDKFLSNQLVRQLGFPGVVHGVADTVDAAGRIARQIGYPLVVKPLDRGKGRGVTMNVAEKRALAEAFSRAAAIAPGRVLIERQVVGDGVHTVTELIDAENARRTPALAAGFIVALTPDADMDAMLARQGLGPGDRPAAGTVVRLRDIANVAVGGMIEDCSARIHPDNRALFETIARGFHLDAAGIDFVAPDIATSWRDESCAVIEVNQTPGFSSDARAQIVLDEKFAAGADGRNPRWSWSAPMATCLKPPPRRCRHGACAPGAAPRAATLLDRQPRCGQAASLPERVQALLLDPACEALALAVTPDGLAQHGFPLDRCDVVLLDRGTDLSASLRSLVDACAAAVIEDVDTASFEARARDAIDAAAAQRSRTART